MGLRAHLMKMKWRGRMLSGWPRSRFWDLGVPAGTHFREKPRSQKRDLGHPLKVWRLQIDFHQSW
jgi:hypothetical protein